jgi:hypothetical protein
MIPFYPPFYYNNRHPYYKGPSNNYQSLRNNTTSSNRSFQGLSHDDNKNFKDNSSCSKSDSDSQYFDLFGIRLYFDDILILCLLFFLYQEKVDDQLLFIALLLLLLS